MKHRVHDTLAAAREAYAAASRALRLAEEAAGLAGSPDPGPVLEELTVKRINVVEDDGTLRIVIGNSTHARAVPMRGRLVNHPERGASAGMLFVNDEGTECGGLQLAGLRGGSGRLILRDGEGRDRLRFIVPGEGDPVAEVVDSDGNARSFL